ncbi:Metallo-dependent phosphatase [Myriangium duriaei CBS 260.36]|uniref:Metallo-dependent phosphatase n=1 Tax=Myriangium duriaei CBS 260.36 TaxID=1168546 RepID=A0A9P4MDU5_9PEZI|nr:Metallo-dependent phosphatase [Myriangium duriaei CBS 260.36]
MFRSSVRQTGLNDLFNRPRPSPWQKLFQQPCLYLARLLYTARPVLQRHPGPQAVSVVCISDTHNTQPVLPDGDILIHAGDLTQSGTAQELRTALAWSRSQSHPIKVVIAGNHDLLLDTSRDGTYGDMDAERQSLDWGNIIYLQNSETTVTCANGRQIRIYGSPLSPKHGNWAFQYPREENVWTNTIPDGVDILVTHGPPRGHLDLLTYGCTNLLGELWRVRPRLHVFGHVHEGYGSEWIRFDDLQKAYECTVVANGGIGNLCLTTAACIRSLFGPPARGKCLLVNAAMVGGLRDDERRQAIRVVI